MKTKMICQRCGKPVASANGIYVHVTTAQAVSFETGLHYAKPVGK